VIIDNYKYYSDYRVKRYFEMKRIVNLKTTICISKNSKKKLSFLGKKGETFEDIINKLMRKKK